MHNDPSAVPLLLGMVWVNPYLQTSIQINFQATKIFQLTKTEFSRATTEFTGWPSPSTTPISIEKILAAAKAAASTSTTEENTPSTTTTTTTTTTTPAPTTPGVCTAECDLAATIKLVGGAKWVPELLDHNTQEWQTLANEVRDQVCKIQLFKLLKNPY